MCSHSPEFSHRMEAIGKLSKCVSFLLCLAMTSILCLVRFPATTTGRVSSYSDLPRILCTFVRLRAPLGEQPSCTLAGGHPWSLHTHLVVFLLTFFTLQIYALFSLVRKYVPTFPFKNASTQAIPVWFAIAVIKYLEKAIWGGRGLSHIMTLRL